MSDPVVHFGSSFESGKRWDDLPSSVPSTLQKDITRIDYLRTKNSGFSGFPFPVIEKDEKGDVLTEWDLTTVWDNGHSVKIPSKQSDTYIPVVGPGTSWPVGMSLKDLQDLFWKFRVYEFTFSIGWETDLGDHPYFFFYREGSDTHGYGVMSYQNYAFGESFNSDTEEYEVASTLSRELIQTSVNLEHLKRNSEGNWIYGYMWYPGASFTHFISTQYGDMTVRGSMDRKVGDGEGGYGHEIISILLTEWTARVTTTLFAAVGDKKFPMVCGKIGDLYYPTIIISGSSYNARHNTRAGAFSSNCSFYSSVEPSSVEKTSDGSVWLHTHEIPMFRQKINLTTGHAESGYFTFNATPKINFQYK